MVKGIYYTDKVLISLHEKYPYAIRELKRRIAKEIFRDIEKYGLIKAKARRGYIRLNDNQAAHLKNKWCEE